MATAPFSEVCPDAAHFGHHDVEDDEGDVFLGVEGVYGLFAVTGFDDVVSGFY